MSKLKKHVILIGFMGSGKTTIGMQLAETLDLPKYDCDKTVEKTAGKSIPDIFETEGEDAFRSYEHHVMLDLLKEQPGIIMTGGGFISTPKGRQILSDVDAHIVWLKVDFETVADRIRKDTVTSRPLFEDRHKGGALFNLRHHLYEEAATIVIDANKSVTDIVDEIVKEVS